MQQLFLKSFYTKQLSWHCAYFIRMLLSWERKWLLRSSPLSLSLIRGLFLWKLMSGLRSWHFPRSESMNTREQNAQWRSNRNENKQLSKKKERRKKYFSKFDHKPHLRGLFFLKKMLTTFFLSTCFHICLSTLVYIFC